MTKRTIVSYAVALISVASVASTALAQRENQANSVNGSGASMEVRRGRGITDEQRENMNRRIALATDMVNRLESQAKARGRGAGWRRSTLDSLLMLPVAALERLHGRVNDPDAIADAIGDIDPASSAASTSDLVYTPIAPCRYIDTRNVGGKVSTTPRGYDLGVAGSTHGGDAPCNPTALFNVGQDEFGAIAMNVTIVDPSTSPGFLAIKPTAAAPTTSLINWYEAGPSVQAANQGIVTIDQDVPTAAEFVIVASGPVHVIVDIFGAFIAPQWGTVPIELTFMPHPQVATCVLSTADVPLGGATWGATTSTSNVTVGSMFFLQTGGSPNLGTAYARGRLAGLCRGNGVIELREGATCQNILATIQCTGGLRPWTVASSEFDVSTTVSGMALTVRLRATSGTLEWADLKLLLYK